MVGRERSPLKVNGKDVITGLIGGFITIFTLAILTSLTSAEWLIHFGYDHEMSVKKLKILDHLLRTLILLQKLVPQYK